MSDLDLDLRDVAAGDLFEVALACRLERLGPVESIRRFCDFSHDVDPHPIWSEIAALPIQEDVAALESRLRALLAAEPIPANIAFLHFGMFLGYEGGESMADARTRFYVAGHSVFDEDDPGEAFDNAWWPEGRYLDSATLATISRMCDLLGPPDSLYAADSFLLACAEAIALELARRLAPELLGGAASRALGVCHDDGDMVFLGRLAPAGFAPSAAIPIPPDDIPDDIPHEDDCDES